MPDKAQTQTAPAAPKDAAGNTSGNTGLPEDAFDSMQAGIDKQTKTEEQIAKDHLYDGPESSAVASTEARAKELKEREERQSKATEKAASEG